MTIDPMTVGSTCLQAQQMKFYLPLTSTQDYSKQMEYIEKYLAETCPNTKEIVENAARQEMQDPAMREYVENAIREGVREGVADVVREGLQGFANMIQSYNLDIVGAAALFAVGSFFLYKGLKHYRKNKRSDDRLLT